jgi:hypothetical protein
MYPNTLHTYIFLKNNNNKFAVPLADEPTACRHWLMSQQERMLRATSVAQSLQYHQGTIAYGIQRVRS